MFRKLIAFLLLCSFAVNAAEIPTGSKLRKGLMDYLPNFAEVNFVVSMANIYMQASSLVRSVNATVTSMNNAVDKLQEAKETSEKLWGDIQRLKNINIYDMDSWAEGISTLRYDVIGSDMIGINNLLTSGALDVIDGSIGAYVKVQNGLSYDAREIGIGNAYKAYYYQEDWAKYKADNGFENQTQQVQEKIELYERAKKEREEVRNWVCPEGLDANTCKGMMHMNQQIKEGMEDAMEQANDDIDKMTDKVSVSQLTRNAGYLQLDYIETALKRIHLASEDYATAYQQINSASAAVARKAQKFLTGRLTSRKRDPSPRPAADLSGPSIQELCSRPENIETKPDGTSSCIYSETDRNKTDLPKEDYHAIDMLVDAANEIPRDPSLSDFQKLKAEIAYINLQQEQLLFDMEMDQTYLELVSLARKTTKVVDHRRKLRSIQEGLGNAVAIMSTNNFPSNDIRKVYFENLKPKAPWDMSKTLEVNLAK